jgi:hypothetical protein
MGTESIEDILSGRARLRVVVSMGIGIEFDPVKIDA